MSQATHNESWDKATRKERNRAVFGCEEKTEAAKPLLHEDFGFKEEELND